MILKSIIDNFCKHFAQTVLEQAQNLKKLTFTAHIQLNLKHGLPLKLPLKWQKQIYVNYFQAMYQTKILAGIKSPKSLPACVAGLKTYKTLSVR